jgi:glycosyltransferase involved in cell wall biosynthesis
MNALHRRSDGDGVIGVVIRALNESEFIGRCLETLQRQRGNFDLDIVVVDSGSTDATVEIARSYQARIVSLAPTDFDYSKALNVGIEAARGEVVVSLSAHAIPLDDHWLSAVTAPLEDPRVAGVSSRQVPWPDAPWQEVHRLQHQFGEDACVYADASEREIVFSNAASVIRRSVWREHPFTLPAAEDVEWARRVVAAGWKILYEPTAAVYHSHHEGPRAQALRMMDINRVLDREHRRVTRRQGVREAAGMFVRDSKKILVLDEPVRRKLVYLVDLLRMVSYYVVDFSKTGTTAERRREDSRSASASDAAAPPQGEHPQV